MIEGQEAPEERPVEPPPPVRPVKPSEALKQAEREEDIDILTWFKGVGGDGVGEIRVQLYRALPEKWPVKWPDGRVRDLAIKGHQFTYDLLIEEDKIRADFGGGTYDLRVQKRDEKGRWVVWRGKRVFIGGNPKPDKLLEDDTEWLNAQAEKRTPAAAATSTEAAPLAQQAMTTMKNLLDEKKQEKTGSLDVQSIIAAAQSPLLETIKDLKDDMRAARDKPPAASPDAGSNKALQTILEKSIDGEGARMLALRTQMDSERNQLNTYWMGRVAAAEDGAARSIKTVEDAAAREVKALERAHDTAMQSIKTSFEARIDGLKESIKRLERDLDNTSKELVALRGQKNQTLTEKVDEIKALEEFFDKGEEEKTTTMEQVAAVVTALGNTDLAKGFAARMANGPAGAQPPPQQDPFANVPINTPFLYNGQPVMKLADGRVVPVRKRNKPAAAAGAKQPGPGSQMPNADGTPAAAPPVEEEPLPNIDPADMAKAVSFIESAIDSRTTPEQFAMTAKIPGVIPAGIIAVLRRGGAERLIQLANPSELSPMTTVRGKEWINQVVAILIQ